MSRFLVVHKKNLHLFKCKNLSLDFFKNVTIFNFFYFYFLFVCVCVFFLFFFWGGGGYF